jgi:hypothetical protein
VRLQRTKTHQAGGRIEGFNAQPGFAAARGFELFGRLDADLNELSFQFGSDIRQALKAAHKTALHSAS